METVDDLRLQQKEIEAKIQAQLKADRRSALSDIRKKMKTYRVTFKDIEKSLAPGRGYKVQTVPINN